MNVSLNPEILKPTLWRTCRTLANERRLALLAYLVENGPHRVMDISAECGLPRTTATLYLRALNARGLLRAEREGREVWYQAVSDPLIPEAGILLEAVKHVLLHRRNPLPYIYYQCTAFTHPRRIALVQILAAREVCTWEELRRITSFSLPSLVLHTEKLLERGYLAQHVNSYRLRVQRALFPKTLLNLALHHKI